MYAHSRFPQLRWSKRHPGKFRWVLFEMWPLTDPITQRRAVLVCEQNISQVRKLPANLPTCLQVVRSTACLVGRAHGAACWRGSAQCSGSLVAVPKWLDLNACATSVHVPTCVCRSRHWRSSSSAKTAGASKLSTGTGTMAA